MELIKGQFYRGVDGSHFADHIFMALEDGEDGAWCNTIVISYPRGAVESTGIKTLVHSGNMVGTSFNPRTAFSTPRRGDVVYREGEEQYLFMVSAVKLNDPFIGSCRVDLVALNGYDVGAETTNVNFFEYLFH